MPNSKKPRTKQSALDRPRGADAGAAGRRHDPFPLSQSRKPCSSRGRRQQKPSARVVLQLIRNRIIDYLESFDALTERLGPFETINWWEDWVDERRMAGYVEPVFTADEHKAISAFHATWDSVADALPDAEPDRHALTTSPDWQRLRTAAATTLEVFRRRGRLPEDREIGDE